LTFSLKTDFGFSPFSDMATVWSQLRKAINLRRVPNFRFICGALIAATNIMPLHASDDDSSVRYTMRKGDTLIQFADRYLRTREDYKIVQKQNRIANPYAIPIGKIITIPRNLLQFKPANAKLISVRGHVLASAAAASVGQILQEGASVSTGPSSFATLLLDDGSRVSLPSNSDVRIRRLRSYVLGDSLDYDFDVAKGGVRSSVVKHKSADDRYQVRTPKAVSAVRGTDFQSRFDPDIGSDFAEVVEGSLAVDAGSGGSLALPAGNGLAVKADGGVIAEALLAPPALLEPGKTQADKIVRFTSESQSGTRYIIAADAGFIEQVADTAVADGKASFADIPNGNYFVRARAISDNGIQGMPATFAFKRRLNGVSASASRGDEGYVFRWVGESAGTQRFHFQMFRNATDQVAVVDEAGMSGDRVTLSDLPKGDYYWRVGAVQYLDGEVATNWTPMEKLSVSGT
jgi:hypothetical protein